MDGDEKRVLQFVYLMHDGITSMIFNICEFIDREKVNFDYLAFAKGEPYAYEKIKEFGGRPVVVDVEDIPNPIIRSIRKYYGVYRAIRTYKYEIIHINASTPYDILIGMAARLGGVKRVIFHSHNSRGDKRFRRDIFIPFCRLLIPFVATDYIACSELAAKYMFPRFVYRKKAYALIHNAIDLDKFAYNQAEREKIRKRLGLGNCLVFGNIGRFHPQKNHFFLLKIFAAILKKNNNARLLLVGTGELEDAVKAEAHRLLISDSVIFYGTTSEIPQMFWTMDVYLMPSVYEGLPVTGVEAQAAGLPMLVSNTVSQELRLTELVHYMSLKRSVGEWAAAAMALAGNDRADYRNELKRKGYDIQDIAEEVRGIYET